MTILTVLISSSLHKVSFFMKDSSAFLILIKEFLEVSFEEEELEIPSDAEIVSCVMERVQEQV